MKIIGKKYFYSKNPIEWRNKQYSILDQKGAVEMVQILKQLSQKFKTQ